MRTIGDVTVNDGKGLYDNQGLCDSIINDMNQMLKAMLSGQYVQGCTIVTGMAQKLVNLKQGIANDMDSMRTKVEELKRMNDSLVEQQTGLPVERNEEHGEN